MGGLLGILEKTAGPIGVAVAGRSVRMAQTCRKAERSLETSSAAILSEDGPQGLSNAIRAALDARGFQGRDAVMCLGVADLFLQNLRVPPGSPDEIHAAVMEDAKPRLPCPAEEMEIRYVEAGDVRHADAAKREVVVVACHRPRIDALLQAAEEAQLNPIAIDTEPGALQRCFYGQFRRVEEREARVLLVHVGPESTCVMITRQSQTVLAKHLPVGGRDLNQAVADEFDLSVEEAARLRKRATVEHGGDPAIQRAVDEAVRQVVEQLCREIALCIRYFCVTFRTPAIERFLLCGPEADSSLALACQQRTGVDCQCSQPFLRLAGGPPAFRPGQWDLAVGLALRGVLD